MRTRKALSTLLALSMLLALCITSAFASGSSYTAGLAVTKVDDSKISIGCEVGPSGTSASIQGGQGFIVAFNTAIFKPLLKNGTTTFELASSPEKKSMAFDEWENPDTLETWSTNVYAYKSADGKTGFLIIQPGNAEIATITGTITLAKVYLGFQTGKGYDDVTSADVRFATAAELTGMAENKALKLSDGTETYKWSNGDTGDTLSFAEGSEPKATASGFTFVKAAYAGEAAAITAVARQSDGKLKVTATVPSGEAAQYGYASTNSASSVANWQDSSILSVSAPGTYYFFARVKANDAHEAGGASAGYALTVYEAVSLAYTAPESMTIGAAITPMEPDVSGGSNTFNSYAVISGTLPGGLTLNAANGVISGTPTAASAAVSVTVKVTDTAGNTAEHTISFPAVGKKANAVSFTAPAAQFVEGQAVSFAATATSGTPSYSYRKSGESTWTAAAPTAIGDYTVKASVAESDEYAAAEATHNFKIVAKAVGSITVTPPTKLSYVVGQSFDPAGMSIYVEYNDGTNETIAAAQFEAKGVAVTGFSSAAPAAAQTVTVVFGEKTDTFTVAIEAKTLLSIAVTTPPTKTGGYKAFETLSTDGMVVTATYNSGAEPVTGYTVTYLTGTSFRAGDTKATVTFGGKSADVTVDAVAKAALDTSGITWSGSDSFAYDGNAHSVVLTGLPVGVTAGYTGNEKTYVGSYTAVATLNYDTANYDLTASVADLSWSITAVAQTPAIAPAASLAKGGNSLSLAPLVTDAKGDTVTFSIFSGDAATLSGSTLTSAADKTGTVVIKVTISAKDVDGDGTAEYTAYSKDDAITVTVTDKISAALPNGVSQTGCTYGETLPDPTYDVPAGTLTTSVTYAGTTHAGAAYSDSAKPTEAGSYTVTVVCETATHIYTAAPAAFTIAPKSITGAEVTLSSTTAVYNGGTHTVTVTAVEGGLTAADYTVSGDLSKMNAGSYTVTVTGKGNYKDSASASWTISPMPLTFEKATVASRDYAAGELGVDVTSVDFVETSALVKGTHYNAAGVMADDNAGSKPVQVTVTMLDGNYTLAGTNPFPATAVINKIDPAAPTGITGETGSRLSTVILPTGWSWADGEIIMEEGAQTYLANFAGSTNYNAKSDVTVTVTVADAPADPTPAPAPVYAITAQPTVNGSLTLSDTTAQRGETVTVTVTPDKGYTLETLTVLKKNGAQVALTDNGNGQYTFRMPSSQVTVAATFAEDNTMLNFFVDVDPSDYFYDAVLWAVKNNITTGVSETHFAPHMSCNRAQIVTFLYRCAAAQGIDLSVGEDTNILSYTDVLDIPEYAFAAFQWACGANIIQGYDGKLMPNEDCTRAQIVTMLSRYAAVAGKDTGVGEDTNILSYTDALDIPEYAFASFQWACGANIIQGYNGQLMPNTVCTRAQIVTILYRFMK